MAFGSLDRGQEWSVGQAAVANMRRAETWESPHWTRQSFSSS
jgi:hypothetical protein